jgi:putative peptide zinc metalloprotease protein
MERPTHSTNWHRIGPLRPHLRPGVTVHRRHYRRQRAYVLRDPVTNQFFRLDPVSYYLISLLDGTRTVEQAWWQAIDRYGDKAPTQNESVGLLTQMYQMNLLAVEGAADADQLFERKQRRAQSKMKKRAASFMFIQVPLGNPAPILDWLLPLTRWMFTRWFLLAWLMIVLAAVVGVTIRYEQFAGESVGLLRPGNLPWVALIYIGSRLIHEFAHGLVCRNYGGDVYEMGVKLLVFFPVPYCDATSSWGFSSKYHRAAVAAAGIVVETSIAAVAVLTWVNTAPGIVHELAYSTIFIAGLGSLLFNTNPLLRYDGYFVLSDLLDIPNLYQLATKQVQYLIQHYVFGMRQTRRVTTEAKQAFWLTTYSVVGWAYRILIIASIVWFVSGTLLGAGIVLAAAVVVSMVLMPLVKYVSWLSNDPSLGKQRPRAVLVTLLLIGGVLMGLGIFPVSEYVRAEAVIEPAHRVPLVLGADGFIRRVVVEDGGLVRKGDVILEADSPQLRAMTKRVDALLDEARAEQLRIFSISPERRESVKAQIDMLMRRRQQINRRLDGLTIRSTVDGLLVAPRLTELPGRHIDRGTLLGYVHTDGPMHALAVVDQRDNARLFGVGRGAKHVEVRTVGNVARVIQGRINSDDPGSVRPAGQHLLKYPQFTFLGGGQAKGEAADQTGRVVVEGMFEVNVELDLGGQDPPLLPGQRAIVRMDVGKRPLLSQWYRWLLQLFQMRSLG